MGSGTRRRREGAGEWFLYGSHMQCYRGGKPASMVLVLKKERAVEIWRSDTRFWTIRTRTPPSGDPTSRDLDLIRCAELTVTALLRNGNRDSAEVHDRAAGLSLYRELSGDGGAAASTAAGSAAGATTARAACSARSACASATRTTASTATSRTTRTP